MRALISIEAPSLQGEGLRRLLNPRFRVVSADDAHEPADCVLIAHAPPEADALAALAARDREEPVAAVVVVAGEVDPQLRRAALRAGAMEVVALAGLASDTLTEAIEDALARRTFARRAARPEGAVDTAEVAERERRKLLALVEHSRDFIATADLDGRFTYVNPGGRRMVGVGADEDVRAIPFARFIAERSREMFLSTVVDAVQARGSWEGELLLRNVTTKRVFEVFCYTFLLRDPHTGDPWCYASVTRDVSAQKAVEARLSLANARLRATLTANDVGIWDWDPHLDMVVGDRNLVRLFGVEAPADHSPLAPYLARIHPDDRPRVEAAVARVVAEGGVYDEVYRVVRDEGGVRWLHARGLVELNPEGRPTTFPGIALDVTRSVEATERLRESDERYRALLESIDDGFCIIEVIFDAGGERAVDYRFIELNESFARQTGLVDAAGKTARALVPELDEFWYETYGRVALTGETARFERHEPALSRWFEVEALRVGAPERRRVALVFRDATQRHISEAALRESEHRALEAAARFQTLADNMAQLAWMADENGAVTWCNRRWFEYTGTTLDEMRSEGRMRVHHPDHAARVAEKFRAHIVSGEAWEDTFPMRSASGEYRWFLSRAIPIRDAEGGGVRWFGTNTDVTAQREAEEALRDADRRKDEFIAILAHELRNPLAPVRNAVQILKLVGPQEPRLNRAREVIDRQVTHMARLIDDLLDVSRIARGKLALQMQTCDLAAIARQTAEDYRANLEAEGLTLTLAAAEEPAWVEGDPVRLAQMIANLLHNAGRFTSRGGRVEVRVAVDRATERAVLQVIDTGVGIEPGLLARLFDPFSQAEQDLARSKGGLGLGLALTRGLAGLHGGEVSADSGGIGRGSTFTLRIPLARARYEAAPREASAPPKRARPGLLVIEDNHDAAETLRDLLVLLGYEVEVAFDGASALEIARAFRPDAVVSDLGLPGELDGYAVARALRADPSFEGVYLIALSGYANEEARRRSREAGFDVHFAKPPDIDKLEATLAAVSARGVSAKA